MQLSNMGNTRYKATLLRFAGNSFLMDLKPSRISNTKYVPSNSIQYSILYSIVKLIKSSRSFLPRNHSNGFGPHHTKPGRIDLVASHSIRLELGDALSVILRRQRSSLPVGKSMIARGLFNRSSPTSQPEYIYGFLPPIF